MKNYTKIVYLIAVAFILGFNSTAEAADVYSTAGWAYKVKININNPTSTSPTVPANYPVKIAVPAKTYIDAGKMNSDMRDIRFADSAGNPLPFWIGITENMIRTFNNIPVYVKLNTFNSGDNVIYMYFDKTKVKGNKAPQSNFTTSDTIYCGDGGITSSVPYSSEACGDNTFSFFSFDCTNTDWTQDSGCIGGANKKWVSKNKYGTSSNATDIHFRTHFYNSMGSMYAYFLTQNTAAPASASIDKYCGYKLWYEGGTPSTANDTLNMDNNILHVQKKTASCGTNSNGWGDVATLSNWKPYNNSIQDFDIKTSSSVINVLVNGNLIGSANRTDSWTTGGYVGFNRGTWTQGAEGGSNSTDGISPIWVINNYVGADPIVTFVGNTDIMIKKISPIADLSYLGQDVIENSPQNQILESAVDGDTLDKYVYNGYPAASPSKQIFKSAITIRNRGSVSDTFNIKLTNSGTTSQWSTSFDQDGAGYYGVLPGTGATPTTGTVTLAGGASTVITVIVIPTANDLFEGSYGSFIMDIAVTSASDYSFDNARFLFNINGKTGCYWNHKLPVTISYNDTNSTGKLVDYQVQVNLAAMDLSAARPDGADIIFTDVNGTALPFWRKSPNSSNVTWTSSSSTASYWVKVHNLAAGTPGSTTIYMWWGNSNYSPSRSDKKSTFDLWEDWETDSTPGAVNYSGVGAVAGCPDGTSECAGQPTDPHGWKNYPQPSNNFDWWSIQSKLDGKAVKAGAHGSSDFGPVLAGGDIRWQNYEVSYSFLTEFAGTTALYNPIYFQDGGNGWGMEFFDNKLIYRPFGFGTDWTWARQINASAKLGNSTFPANNKRYWVKIRIFRNPNPLDKNTHVKLFISPIDSGTTAPADTDADANYVEVTPATVGIIPDASFDIKNGMIGFGGWDGGFSTDNIRIRKYTEPQPVCTNGTPTETNYASIASMSMPVITPPLLNGRPVLLNGMLDTFKWTGDLQAVYADCYIAGDCQPGEDATKTGTISLWGKFNDTTPKGFGERLKNATAGDNNRSLIDDASWQTNGRYIFTAYDSNNDGKISCTTTSADCIALGTTNAVTLRNLIGYDLETSPYTQTTNLIKFVRGQYVAGFTRSEVRNQCSFSGIPSVQGTDDTCQWKLGDIAHSSPLVVGVPNMLYADSAYDAFRAANNYRDMVAYTGSNAGMLHAVRMSTFDSTTKKYTTDSSATELWSYVPNALLPVLINTTNNFHEYTNDGLLRALDIKTTGVGGTYKTVLIGSLRSGGQSLYALDITNPRTANLMWEVNNSTNAAEFTKIGKSWSAPALGRLCKTTPCDSTSTTNPWVAIIGSGFSPNNIDNLSKAAYVSFVDIETGVIIKQINVSTKPGNLTTNIGVLRDKNGYIQKAFLGDYYGALWRIDLTTPTKVAAILAVAKTVLENTDMLFKPSDYATSNVTDAAKLPLRPITSQPTTAYSKNSSGIGEWWVYFGTGVFDTYDSSYPYQRMYALKDTVVTPYIDTNLTNMTSTTATNTTKNSWYIELGQSDSKDYGYAGTSTASCVTTCINQNYSADYCASKCRDVSASLKDRNERIISSPTVYGGFVFFSTFTPSNDPCSGGSSRFYAVSYLTGSYSDNLLLFGNANNGRSIAISTSGGVPSTPMIYSGKNGSGQIVGSGSVSTSTGGGSGRGGVPLDPTQFSMNVNLLLWRRVR